MYLLQVLFKPLPAIFDLFVCLFCKSVKEYTNIIILIYFLLTLFEIATNRNYKEMECVCVYIYIHYYYYYYCFFFCFVLFVCFFIYFFLFG